MHCIAVFPLKLLLVGHIPIMYPQLSWMVTKRNSVVKQASEFEEVVKGISLYITMLLCSAGKTFLLKCPEKLCCHWRICVFLLQDNENQATDSHYLFALSPESCKPHLWFNFHIVLHLITWIFLFCNFFSGVDLLVHFVLLVFFYIYIFFFYVFIVKHLKAHIYKVFLIYLISKDG